jgi:hypothetical protein
MTVMIHLVTDRDPADADCTALIRDLRQAVPDATVQLRTVAPGDTLAAGVQVAELARTVTATQQLVAHDVTAAPGQPGPWPEGAVERLCVGRSAAGALIVGPNAGYAWSFVVDDLRGLCCLDVALREGGSRAAALVTAVDHVAKGHPHAVTSAVPCSQIPAPPAGAPTEIRHPGPA